MSCQIENIDKWIDYFKELNKNSTIEKYNNSNGKLTRDGQKWI
jgi:predicted transcriptional regulator